MHYPRARSRWQFWVRRQCAVCGLPWKCDEAVRQDVRARFAPGDRTATWQRLPTQAWPQVGRPGALTPAQDYRANGGKW
ncbi:hypothetical protein KRM28CT15_12260 [Krasilnikovia sp. M28-CT-15]